MSLITAPQYKTFPGVTDNAYAMVPLQADGSAMPAFPSWEGATREGNAYVASTTVQTVSAANFMGSIFSNPLNSGKNCYLAMREFAGNVTTSALEYQAYVNPTATMPNTALSSNMMIGNTNNAVGVLKYQIASSITMGGQPASGGFLPVSDEPRQLLYLGIITPGNSLGYLIQGSGGGALQNQARITMSYFWWEEPI